MNIKFILPFIIVLIFGCALVFIWKVYSPLLSKPTILPKTSFSLSRAPVLSLRATIATLSGDVFWQSRTATQASIVRFPRVIQQGEELETHDTGSVTIVFYHIGSLILLPKTTVNIVQTLPVDIVFDESQGTVNIVKGSDQPPFSLRTPGLLVTVYHGNSVLSVDPITKQTTIVVQTGSVNISYDDTNNVTNLVTLTQGDQILFDSLSKTYINY